MKNALAVRKESAVGQETSFGGNNCLTNRRLTNYRSTKERGRDRRAGNRERSGMSVKFFPPDGFQRFTTGEFRCVSGSSFCAAEHFHRLMTYTVKSCNKPLSRARATRSHFQ